MKKVTGGWGSTGVGRLDRLSWRCQAPCLGGGCGGAACSLATVVKHAVLCRSDSGESGPRRVALAVRFVCSQKSAREGRALLLPSRSVTTGVELRLGLRRFHLCAGSGSHVGGFPLKVLSSCFPLTIGETSEMCRYPLNSEKPYSSVFSLVS